MRSVFVALLRFRSKWRKISFMGWMQLSAKRSGCWTDAGIETVWSKKSILTVCLNIAKFVDGIFFGVKATQRYFNKPANRLNMIEAAQSIAL